MNWTGSHRTVLMIHLSERLLPSLPLYIFNSNLVEICETNDVVCAAITVLNFTLLLTPNFHIHKLIFNVVLLTLMWYGTFLNIIILI